jgi:hypothetical protein
MVFKSTHRLGLVEILGRFFAAINLIVNLNSQLNIKQQITALLKMESQF